MLPDVDLVVRATRTGFTHVLVVKTASAAANPAVRSVHFDVAGDVEIIESGNGALRAMAGGEVVAVGQPPVMWDSAQSWPEGSDVVTGQGLAERSADPTSGSGSSADGASDAAQIVPVDAQVTTDGDLVLVPDTALLANGAFPLYIDPPWDDDDNRWAYATNNNSSNTDYTSARVGKNPDTGVLYRSFFEFPTTDENIVPLRGRQIRSAKVQIELDHSWSCGPTKTNLYRTSLIDATMRATWSKMKLVNHLDAVDANANEDGGCSSLQPDVTVNFAAAAVTAQVQTAATSNWTTITVGLCACNDAAGSSETSQDRWKRYNPAKAFLVVDYNTAPTAPTDLRFGTFTCPSAPELTAPPLTGSVSTTLEALANDADGGTADVTFRRVEIPAGTTNPDTLTGYTDVTYTSKPVNSKAAGQAPNASRVQAPVTGLVDGKVYGFKVKSRDPNTVTGFSADSPWSQWCVFAVDVGIPPTPGLSSANCPEDQTTAVGPGETCTVQMTTTATDAAYFEYWFEGQSHRTVAVDADKQVDVPVTPIKYGLNTFNVFVVDTSGHPSASERTYSFYVASPSKPQAHWDLEELPPSFDQSAALHDQGLGTVTNLTSFNGTWDADTRLVGARTAGFNGTSQAATATGPVVSTTGSFSISAWVRLGALPTDDNTAVTQDGTDAAGFQLGVRMVGSPLAPRWSFTMKDTSAQSSATKTAFSPNALTAADVGQWTHIAGVYDTNAKKIRLYVNGVLLGGTDRTTASWQATGNFAVGRGFASGAASKWWKGSVADVRAWDRALVAEDFTPQPISGDVGLVDHDITAQWNFDAIRLCTPMVCPTVTDVSTFGRELQLQPGSLTGPDQSPASETCQLGGRYTVAVFDTCDLDYSDPGSSGPEFGTVLKDYGTAGAPDWRHAPVVRTDTSFTVSAWVRPQEDSLLTGCRTVVAQDATVVGGPVSGFYLRSCPQLESGGTTTARWQVMMRDTAAASGSGVTVTGLQPIASSADPSVAALTAGRWTFLTAVYDTTTREIRLYVDGVLQGSAVRPANTAWNAVGALTLGRARWFDALHADGMDADFFLGGVDQVTVYAGVLDQTAIDQAYLAENEAPPQQG
ncbi:LamG domain-containing protein [Catellatospora sp. TT07R-123]|uniref:LamG domain-containing protein n=1 Tax=Catellatospora sp. TT07R-123 TaxID=2733863 RepID=UPI001BB3654F|nr:LamG domain-containing protein [Catellatospora sp. TT07R-123]